MMRFAACLACAVVSTAASTTLYVQRDGVTWQEQVALSTCAGLLNRWDSPVYLINGGDTTTWLKLIDNVTSPKLTSNDDFLSACFQSVARGRYIRYNATTHQALLPNIVTLAAVLDAVPLDVSINATHVDATVLVLDLLTVFPAGTTPYDATEYVYNKHVNMTTGLVKMNPGYESQTGKKILDPKINHPPATGLVDYIVKERLFNLYLPDGCIPLTHEHALMKKIAENNPWPKPIAVMGYDNTVVFAGGDFFEAETSCVKEVAMGQMASANPITIPDPNPDPNPKVPTRSHKQLHPVRSPDQIRVKKHI